MWTDTCSFSSRCALTNETQPLTWTQARNRNSNVSMEQGINRIVEGTVVEGAIRSEGSIRIDGRFVGDIRTEGRLVIGSTGSVEGHRGVCGL